MATTNGSKRGRSHSKDKVRVAIVGVGNCANSLLQGVQYYKDAKPSDSVPGLMHVDLGGYHISDIEFVAAFDVVNGKVGVDLAEEHIGTTAPGVTTYTASGLTSATTYYFEVRAIDAAGNADTNTVQRSVAIP